MCCVQRKTTPPHIPEDIRLPGELLQAAAEAVGIELDRYELRMYGRCGTCERKKT